MKAKQLGMIISFFFLLLGSAYFGFMHQPKEMALSIISAAIALAFLNIDKIERFSGAGFEAEMRKNIEVMVEAQTEPVPENSAESYDANEIEINELSLKILQALRNPKYTWRYTAGITQEIEIPRNKVQSALDELSSQGLVVYGKGKNGKGLIWALSSEGRALAVAKARENDA